MNGERAVFLILGIRKADTPERLLGIPRWDGNAATLDAAIRTRVAQILSHPMKHSDEANFVRQAIKEAGILLRKQCNTFSEEVQTKEETHEITQLDRSIIAVLVSEGGWNRRSRARLVAVSASYGLSVGGLLRILTALADSSRSGSGPLSQQGRSENMPDRSWATLPIAQRKQSVVDDLMDEMANRFLPELKEYSTIATVKLSVLFGLLTILAIILGLFIINVADKGARKTGDAGVVPAITITSEFVHPDLVTNQTRSFDIYPSFEEVIFTDEVGVLVDSALELPTILRDFQLQVTRAGAQGRHVDAELLLDWNHSIHVISSIWPFLDTLLQEEIGKLIHDTVAISPQVEGLPAKLLAPLRIAAKALPSDAGAFEKPWAIGELSRLACSDSLISSLITLVKDSAYAYPLDCDVSETRRLVIRLLGIDLTKITELDSHNFLLWEQWLAMIERENDPLVRTAFILDVMQLILRNSVDLTRESNTRKVLGRLVQEIDWIRSDLARDFILKVYLDKTITSVDVWALSNMLVDLHAVPWFLKKHAIELNDRFEKRERVATELHGVWPTVQAPKQIVHTLVLPAGFDPALVDVWLELTLICQDQSLPPAERFLHARQLNEIAASLWIGRPSRSWELIDNIDQSTLYEDDVEPRQGGRSSGQLAKRFPNTNRDVDEMLALLNFIHNAEYTSLHPRDAALVARAALFYRETSIRQEAVLLICEQFSQSPIVAEALVNVLTPNAKSAQVEALVAFLTDDILPPRHHETWITSARRALIQHALIAGRDDLAGLNEAAASASVSTLGEALFIDPTRLRPTQEIGVSDSYNLLIEAWRKKLGVSYARSTHDSAGVLEYQLQQQLEYLRLIQQLELVWTGELSQVDDMITISKASTLLEQITRTEIASLQVWKRMLTLAYEEFEKDAQQ
ncbi:MAG: hypothetical protein H8E91_01565 [Planctomycetes bacterium]|nr:hypothetical protein [Planctomycetota bacterium]